MATHKKQFFKRHSVKEDSLSLGEISKISGVSFADLKEVYERGRGAWKTNIASVRVKGSYKKDPSAPRSAKLSAEQWGQARVYAFVNKLDRIKEGKQKRLNQDCDVAKKYYKDFKCDIN